MQVENLARFDKSLPGGAGATTIHNLTGGGKVFEAQVMGKVPGSYAIYEKQVDAAGRTTLFRITTVGPDGTLIQIKQKFP